MEVGEKIIIKQDRCKQFYLTILSMAFFIAAFWLIIGDFSNNHLAKRYGLLILSVGVCGIMFFGITTLFLFYRLIAPKDILILHKEGFIEHSTMASLGFVAWDDVTTITSWVVGKQRMVGVSIKDIDKLLSGKSWYKRKLTYANMTCGYPPITINLNSTKKNIDDVILMMNHFLEEWKNTYK